MYVGRPIKKHRIEISKEEKDLDEATVSRRRRSFMFYSEREVYSREAPCNVDQYTVIKKNSCKQKMSGP